MEHDVDDGMSCCVCSRKELLLDPRRAQSGGCMYWYDVCNVYVDCVRVVACGMWNVEGVEMHDVVVCVVCVVVVVLAHACMGYNIQHDVGLFLAHGDHSQHTSCQEE